MRVSSIKQQVKNPQRVSIFVDGKYSFSLSLDELLREKIKRLEKTYQEIWDDLCDVLTEGGPSVALDG